MVTEQNFRLFGHIARSAPDEDHHRAVAAVICKSPSDWKRPPGRPNDAWLGANESDLRLLNIGPSYVWKKAASQEHWRAIVDVLCSRTVCHEEEEEEEEEAIQRRDADARDQ